MLLALPNHAFFLHTSSPFPLGFSLASMLSTIYDKWGGLRGGPILPSKNGMAPDNGGMADSDEEVLTNLTAAMMAKFAAAWAEDKLKCSDSTGPF